MYLLRISFWKFYLFYS